QYSVIISYFGSSSFPFMYKLYASLYNTEFVSFEKSNTIQFSVTLSVVGNNRPFFPQYGNKEGKYPGTVFVQQEMHVGGSKESGKFSLKPLSAPSSFDQAMISWAMLLPYSMEVVIANFDCFLL